MRKWILRGTTLKTPFHIALFAFIQITLHFFQGRISAMPDIGAHILVAISKTGMCLLTLSVFFTNVLLFWFSADQCLKKVYFLIF